ncbi:hypothetical protein EV426DRAFT_677924 [Tirmania nivea]|nr:hypothetical protein EV426DRAFT_677924 [Tirmania nivea]
MSAPRSSRSWRSKSVLVPLALSVAAAATAAGIWLWLDDHDHHHHNHSHDLPSDSEHDSDAGGLSYSALSEGRTRCRTRCRPCTPHRTCSGTGSPSSKPPPPPLGISDSSIRPPLSRVDEESEREHPRSVPSAPLGITSPASASSGGESRTYIPPIKTRTVAFVVSAQSASSNTLLTLLPNPLTIPPNTTLHILIYTPTLSQCAPAGTFHAANTQTRPSPPSKIHDLAYSILPVTYPKEYILPYTTHPTGTLSLLRHLSPKVVYMEETLAGEDGRVLRELISNGSVVEGIVVLGTGPGAIGGKGAKDPTLAGLVDSSDEEGIEKIGYGEAGVKGKEKAVGEKAVEKGKRWWNEPEWDGGRGGGSVLERPYLAEDWQKRVVDRK